MEATFSGSLLPDELWAVGTRVKILDPAEILAIFINSILLLAALKTVQE